MVGVREHDMHGKAYDTLSVSTRTSVSSCRHPYACFRQLLEHHRSVCRMLPNNFPSKIFYRHPFRYSVWLLKSTGLYLDLDNRSWAVRLLKGSIAFAIFALGKFLCSVTANDFLAAVGAEVHYQAYNNLVSTGDIVGSVLKLLVMERALLSMVRSGTKCCAFQNITKNSRFSSYTGSSLANFGPCWAYSSAILCPECGLLFEKLTRLFLSSICSPSFCATQFLT